MIERFSRSLTLRLVAIFLVLGGLFVYGTLGLVRWVYDSDDIRALVSGHLSLHVGYVKEDIGSPPRTDRALAITRSVPVDIRILGPDVDWASDADFPRLSELEFGSSPTFSNDPDAWVDELPGVEFAAKGRHNFLKMRQGDYDIVVSTPRIADQPSGPSLTVLIVLMGLSFLLLGYGAVQWLFRPIRDIREGAAHIGMGRFEHRITKIRSDQLGDLASDINKLAGDVEHMLDAKRALLLGISHELRTPLSRMRLGLEFVEDDEHRRELRAEIIEMDKIVVTLLEAERLNERHARLSRSKVQIGELVSNLVDDFFDRERDRIKVTLADAAVVADIDEARVTLLLKNLVSNALRYSDEAAGPVTVNVQSDDNELIILVSDEGPGISKEHAEHIGEAFYRADPSRARHTGGTGLGLYLASLVARAHGGSLTLVNPGEKGARFEVRLPLQST
jgi:signal transduction histidine kinase